MSDSKREPEDSTSFRSVAVWWRALTCVPIGAVFGFACSVVILCVRGADPMSGPGPWSYTLFMATRGALFGAVYMPVAYLVFLRKEKLSSALIGVAIGTILFGIVGLKFVGIFAPAILNASIGFWGSCMAIYARREQNRNDDGWQGYYSAPMKRKE